jgi:LmbE family N-acetylglucosaminyl deacetylase
MSIVLAVAPHPDDETLGCGGTLLRHRAEGDDIHWLIITAMSEVLGFSAEQIIKRDKEITGIAEAYDFASITRLDLPTALLDTQPLGDLVGAIGGVFGSIQPEIVYAPFPGDAHSDHRVVFDAVSACCKWFRHSSLRRVMACEIPSETDVGIDPTSAPFRPNLFVNVSDYLDKKIQIMKNYDGEMGDFPFPRSEQSIRALAHHRGSQAGYAAAEAFMTLKEIR